MVNVIEFPFRARETPQLKRRYRERCVRWSDVCFKGFQGLRGGTRKGKTYSLKKAPLSAGLWLGFSRLHVHSSQSRLKVDPVGISERRTTARYYEIVPGGLLQNLLPGYSSGAPSNDKEPDTRYRTARCCQLPASVQPLPCTDTCGGPFRQVAG